MSATALRVMKHVPANEAPICYAIAAAAVKRGLVVSVYDGEEWSLKLSSCLDAIGEVVGITDETTLIIRDPFALVDCQPRRIGKVLLVHGNGADVIADYSDNSEMSAILAPAFDRSSWVTA